MTPASFFQRIADAPPPRWPNEFGVHVIEQLTFAPTLAVCVTIAPVGSAMPGYDRQKTPENGGKLGKRWGDFQMLSRNLRSATALAAIAMACAYAAANAADGTPPPA